MTEQEWLKCTDPKWMLTAVKRSLSDRKLRLFSCACCRLVWGLLSDERSRKAVEISERFAEGMASASELEEAFQGAWQAAANLWEGDPVGRQAADAAAKAAAPKNGWGWLHVEDTWEKAALALEGRQIAKLGPEVLDHWDEVCSGSGRTRGSNWFEDGFDADTLIGNIVRESFQFPLNPVNFDPSWRALNVMTVAHTIYEERRFADMPILADALEEAGCTNADILDHCRNGGDHVLGCWAMDLILDRE